MENTLSRIEAHFQSLDVSVPNEKDLFSIQLNLLKFVGMNAPGLFPSLQTRVIKPLATFLNKVLSDIKDDAQRKKIVQTVTSVAFELGTVPIDQSLFYGINITKTLDYPAIGTVFDNETTQRVGDLALYEMNMDSEGNPENPTVVGFAGVGTYTGGKWRIRRMVYTSDMFGNVKDLAPLSELKFAPISAPRAQNAAATGWVTSNTDPRFAKLHHLPANTDWFQWGGISASSDPPFQLNVNLQELSKEQQCLITSAFGAALKNCIQMQDLFDVRVLHFH